MEGLGRIRRNQARSFDPRADFPVTAGRATPPSETTKDPFGSVADDDYSAVPKVAVTVRNFCREARLTRLRRVRITVR